MNRSTLTLAFSLICISFISASSTYASTLPNEYINDFGDKSRPKIQGINTWSVTQKMDIFSANGYSNPRTCPGDPSQGPVASLPDLSPDQKFCHNCIDGATSVTDGSICGYNYREGCYRPEYNCTAPTYESYCGRGTTPQTYWPNCSPPTYQDSCCWGDSPKTCDAPIRTCSLKSGIDSGDWLLDHNGIVLYKTQVAIYNKNFACTNSTAPNMSLRVSKTMSKEYRWDEIGPTCVGKTFQYSNGNLYMGEWTNKDVIGKWNCEDDANGSGCNKPATEKVTKKLKHFQSVYEVNGGDPNLDILTDKVLNTPINDDPKHSETTNMCDSKVTGTTHGPLIDRIKPTIKIAVQGIGATSLETLLDQEETATAGTPKTYQKLSYFAGKGTIQITLVDQNHSTFTPAATWQNYNGVSGIETYTINICRIKDHVGGAAINPQDCIGSPSNAIYTSGSTLTSQYNPDGSIDSTPHTIIDTKNFDATGMNGTHIAGVYKVYVALIDKAGNTNTGSTEFTIVPAGIDTTKTRLDKYDIPTDETPGHTIYTITGTTSKTPGTGTGKYYANAIDTQTYKLSLFDIYGNPIYNWNLYDFSLSATGIYLDEVNKTGSSALFVGDRNSSDWDNAPHGRKTDTNGVWKFLIHSYTPGRFKEQFQFSYNNWDRNGNEIGAKNPYTFPENGSSSLSQTGTFRHILTGALDLYTSKRIDLGTVNDIRMDFFTTTPTSIDTLDTFTLSNFLESLRAMSGTTKSTAFTITMTGQLLSKDADGKYIVQESKYNSGFAFTSSYPTPSFLVGATGAFLPEQIEFASAFTDTLRIGTDPWITLVFGGQTTKYYVSDKEDAFGSGLVQFDTGGLNRIYIEGLTSTAGKNGYVHTNNNVGINSADMRNAVHKNVALLLRNRDESSKGAGTILNRVLYMTGNVESKDLSDLADWDVLVIKGGNFTLGNTYPDTVTADKRNYFFNTGTTVSLDSIAHKGIIVLKDDVTGSGGNIYIKPDVRFIGAALFADESIISVGYDGKFFSGSTSARTAILDKQLVIFGSVFSKNTVGGAVRASSNGQYNLPWKNTTVSLDEAVKFDLAFLRMDNVGFDTDTYIKTLNRDRKEYVIILIDPRNIQKPLPGWR